MINHDIMRLDISVHDASGMAEVQTLQQKYSGTKVQSEAGYSIHSAPTAVGLERQQNIEKRVMRSAVPHSAEPGSLYAGEGECFPF